MGGEKIFIEDLIDGLEKKRNEELFREEHFRTATDIIYKLNSNSKTSFRVSKYLENLQEYQENFIPKFLSFINDKPFLVYSKSNYIHKELVDYMSETLRRNNRGIWKRKHPDLPIPIEDESFLKRIEDLKNSSYMVFAPSAEFYLSNYKFLFNRFMIQAPYVKILNQEVEEGILVQNEGDFNHAWYGPTIDKAIAKSIKEFGESDIKNHVLKFETQFESSLLFYNSSHPLLKSAEEFMNSEYSVLLQDSNFIQRNPKTIFLNN